MSQRICITGVLRANKQDDNKSVYLHYGEIYELKSLTPDDDGLYHITVECDKTLVTARSCPSRTFVILEEPPSPLVFSKIKTKGRLCAYCVEHSLSDELRPQTILEEGSVLDVQYVFPNDPEYTKGYTIITNTMHCQIGNRSTNKQFLLYNVSRQHLHVLEGVDEALSLWDDIH